MQVRDLGHHVVLGKERHAEAEIDGCAVVHHERAVGSVDHPLVAAVGVPIRVRTTESVVPPVDADVLVDRSDSESSVGDCGRPRRVCRTNEDLEFGNGVDYVEIAGVGEEARQDEAVERNDFIGHDPLGDEAGRFDDRRTGIGRCVSGLDIDFLGILQEGSITGVFGRRPSVGGFDRDGATVVGGAGKKGESVEEHGDFRLMNRGGLYARR